MASQKKSEQSKEAENQNQQISEETMPMTSGVPVGKITTDADTYDDAPHEEAVEPFYAAVSALRAAVTSTGAPHLQEMMVNVMPKDRAKAQELVDQIKRLRVGAERLEGIAIETFYARFK